MVFITAAAGPSRLPWRALPSFAAPLLRRHATTDALSGTPDDSTTDVERSDIQAEMEDKTSKQAKLKEMQFYGTEEGYKAWLKTGAAGLFYEANKGQKARWLGGEVPYLTNPSFRPPPPVSNELQNTIYRHLKRGQRTVGQLAEQYNISKARIEAIRKLKQVEDEFRRQASLKSLSNMQLQHAFQTGMEPLLGVQQPIRDTKKPQSILDREAAAQREDMPGTIVEREEEERLDAGIGRGGAFSDVAAQDSAAGGIERTVWEFRSEEMVMKEKQAEAKAAEGAENEAEKQVAEQDAAPDTPEHDHLKAAEQAVKPKAKLQERVVETGKVKYRFVDTSKTSKRR